MAKINYAKLYTRRKDGVYQASYTDKSGKRKYLYSKDPEDLYHKMQEATKPEEEKPIIFRQVAAEWEREHREQITARTWTNYSPHYEDILSQYGDCFFGEVTAVDVTRDIAQAKSKGYSATIVKTRRSIWRMIFDYAVVHGYADFNPVHAVRLPRGLQAGKRSAPTEAEVKTICENADAPFGLFPLFLLCTGMRKAEALALSWSDVDFQNKIIHVTKALDYTNQAHPTYKSPKTEAGIRDVPILDVLLPVLKDEKRRSKNDLLFPTPPSNRAGKGGQLMTERAYEGAWIRYCKTVGFITTDGKPTLTAHQLRHGTATLMYEAGVDELTAQHILGHSRIEITREIYTELRDKQKNASIGKLNKKIKKLYGAM